MMSDSVFARIARREIPAAVVYDDGQVIAFMDAGQVNPGHVLVATRRVAGFVGDDADQLVGVVGLIDEIGADVDQLSVRRRGVEEVLHDHDGDVLGIEPGGDEDRIAFLVQDLVDLGVQYHLGSLAAPALLAITTSPLVP